MRQLLLLLESQLDENQSTLSLNMTLFVYLQFWRKPSLHFCNCQSIPHPIILPLTVHRSKDFNWIDHFRLYTDLNLLNTWEKVVIKPVCQICLKVLVLDCAKVVETFHFNQFLANCWFECWGNSNDRCVDVVLVWNFVYQVSLVQDWIVLDVGHHDDSMFVLCS